MKIAPLLSSKPDINDMASWVGEKLRVAGMGKGKNEVARSELTLQTCLLQGSRTRLGVLSALLLRALQLCQLLPLMTPPLPKPYTL